MLPIQSLVLAGASLAGPPVVPAGPDYAVQTWTIRDGLPQNEVTALAQTPDGSLWVGTFGGLVRFDGLDFEVFDLARTPDLGSNRVLGLRATRDGALYVGTEDAGLVRFTDGHFRAIDDERLGHSVWCLFEDSDGALWVGGTEGLARVVEDRVVEFLDLGEVRAVTESPRGTLWIATSEGLLRRTRGHVTTLRDEKNLVTLLALENGTVLAGLHGERFFERWRGERRERVELPTATRVRALLEDGSGGIWIGDTPWVLRGNRFETPLRAPALSGVRALLEDMEGSIWVGGPEGLHRLRPTPMRGYPLPPSQRAPWIVAADRSEPGALWVALYSGRLFHFRDGVFDPVPDVEATGFAPSADGSVWLADRRAGIERLHDGAVVPVVPAERLEPWAGALALLEDRAGDLWFGAGAQLGRLRGGSLEAWTVADGLPAHEILSLLESASGDLWIGTRGGLARFADGRVVRTWTSGDELPLGPVRALHEDARGRIWAGTYGGGLCCVDADGTVHVFGTEDGLHEAVVSSIFADGPAHLLLLGNRALSRVALAELDERARGAALAIHPRVFDRGPGIDVFEGNGGAMTAGCRTADGLLWLPTREGLVRYDPAYLAPVDVPPPVRIEALRIGDHELAALPSLSVPPGPRDVELRFAARTFVEPERARYLCLLEGHDADWIDVGARRSIVYAGLAPGRYRFRVRAANRDGVWNEDGASIELRLRPWLHETLWFRALALVSVVALGAGALGWRTRRVHRRAELLERQVASRTVELREARDHLEEKVAERTAQLERALRTVREDVARREALEAELRESQRLEAVGRLAGGLAHDFNNMLTAVLGEADLALDALRQDSPAERRQRRHLDEIKRASLRASDLTRQLLAYSRQQILQPEQLAPNATIEGLHGMLRRLVREDIALDLDLRTGVGDVLVDPGQLEQVIVNLVVNASDATTAGGRVTIQTSPEELGAPADAYHVDARAGPYVRIAVRDTGSGIQRGIVDRVFEPFFTTKSPGVGNGLGLASVHGIVKQSGGFVRVESEPGHGTTFEVFLPAVEPARSPAPAAPAPAAEPCDAATILVCDDDGSVLRVMTFVLEADGHRVLAADGPEAALELARAERGAFDLLVTDMVMPGMGGRELAAAVRELRPDVEVLYVSGYTSELLDSSELRRNEDFLQKPFTPAELVRRVARLLALARPGARA